MISNLFKSLKLHAPPTTLVVAILTWIYGTKVSGSNLQEIGQIVTLVLGGAYVPGAAKATGTAATKAKAKLAAPKS